MSERQLQMIELRAEGKTYREIADAFGLTLEGVRTNVRTVYYLLKNRGLEALPEGRTTGFALDELLKAGELKRRFGPKVDTKARFDMEGQVKMMDRFITVNGQEFSFEEVAKALGVECDPKREPVQLHLCQRVNDGVLVAKGAFFDKDDYPAIDLELQLPSEKDSLPIMISRTEQPRVEGAYSDGYQGVRTFTYSREGEYFMRSDVDSRPDSVVDKDGMESPMVVVSGNPYRSAEVYAENHFVMYRGEVPVPRKSKELDVVELQVGMVGTIKDEPGIKKALRGKAFEVTRVDVNGVAAGTIEGMQGIYALDKSYIESVMVPENHQGLINSLAGRMVEFMKEYDFYEFLDSLEAGGEAGAVENLAKELGSIDHVSWFAKFFEEMSYDDELSQDLRTESWKLMEALGELEVKLDTKVPLRMQIESAKGQASKMTEASVPDKGEIGLDL